MERRFLNLVPKRYLCPYCGKWHKWNLSHELGYYNSVSFKAKLGCENQLIDHIHREIQFYFMNGYCYYSTRPTCGGANLDLNGKICIDDIVECFGESRVTFTIPFVTGHYVGWRECYGCDCRDECLICDLCEKRNSRNIEITFGFEFTQSDYEEVVKSARKTILKQPQLNKNEEDTTMANNQNIFNMNCEFGLNKDDTIASTLMGVAIKTGDSWQIYNKEKKEIIDIGNIQLGSFPICIIPATKLSEGDLIKDSGEYYFVIKVEAGRTETLCAKTREIKTIIPVKNLLGFSCYAKVVALSDFPSIGDDFDSEKLAIMSAMCGQNRGSGSQMEQLLPLMLFKKKKFNEGDDTIKFMLMSALMNPEAGGDQGSQLLPLMFLKDAGNDDEIRLLLMSSMMGGNAGGNSNPLMSYLLLKIMDEKDSKQESTDE